MTELLNNRFLCVTLRFTGVTGIFYQCSRKNPVIFKPQSTISPAAMEESAERTSALLCLFPFVIRDFPDINTKPPGVLPLQRAFPTVMAQSVVRDYLLFPFPRQGNHNFLRSGIVIRCNYQSIDGCQIKRIQPVVLNRCGGGCTSDVYRQGCFIQVEIV